MELKLALLFTAREFEFEEALEQWDAMQYVGMRPRIFLPARLICPREVLHFANNRCSGRKEPRPLLDGDKIYQTNLAALGTPTEDLPMRVRVRQHV